MTRLEQIARLSDLRKTKAETLKFNVAAARASLTSAEAGAQKAASDFERTKEQSILDFDALYDSAKDVTNPQNKLESVNRSLLQHRLAVEAARRDLENAQNEVHVARTRLQAATRSYTAAQAQLEGIDTLLQSERLDAEALEDDKADDAALEQFAAINRGRSAWEQ